MCEKPLVPTAKEAEELYRIAKENNKILGVYQNRRFDGDFLTVQKLIKEGTVSQECSEDCSDILSILDNLVGWAWRGSSDIKESGLGWEAWGKSLIASRFLVPPLRCPDRIITHLHYLHMHRLCTCPYTPCVDSLTPAWPDPRPHLLLRQVQTPDPRFRHLERATGRIQRCNIQLGFAHDRSGDCAVWKAKECDVQELGAEGYRGG